MLPTVNKFLHNKYSSQYGSVGIVISRSSIQWHYLKLNKGVVTAVNSGVIEIDEELNLLEEELKGLLKSLETSKAVVNIALSNDMCKYLVIAFDNLPESKKDRQKYIEWAFYKKYKRVSNVPSKQQLSNIRIGSVSTSNGKSYVEVSNVEPEVSQLIDKVTSASKFVDAISPLTCFISKSSFSRLKDIQTRLILILNHVGWQYIWMEGDSILYCRSQLWFEDQSQSLSLIKNDLEQLYHHMDYEFSNHNNIVVLDNDFKIENIENYFPNKSAEIYQYNDICKEHPANDCYSISSYVVAESGLAI